MLVSLPAALAGKLEVRGIGIVPVTFKAQATLRLILDLVERDRVPRFPDKPGTRSILTFR